jgi:regulator of sigma E protease
LRGSITSIKYMIAGDISVKNLQGPIGIARMSGMVAKIGWPEFLGLIGAVSAAIGLFNLFPIPVLDGGHLATYVYEAIMRRPPNRVVMQVLMTMGMVLLLSMMLLASYNDIMRL